MYFSPFQYKLIAYYDMMKKPIIRTMIATGVTSRYYSVHGFGACLVLEEDGVHASVVPGAQLLGEDHDRK